MLSVRTLVPTLLMTIALCTSGRPAFGQDAASSPAFLEALLAEADSVNPSIRTARRAAQRASALVPQAGALPDPMLGLGMMNVPVSDPGIGNDMMTMTQVQLSARFPWPGKLGLMEDAAEFRAEAAEWDVRSARDRVRSDVKSAYFEIHFVDRALAVVSRNLRLLGRFSELVSAMYAVGTGRQPDVLRAQVERTRLAEQEVSLRARRVRAVSRLNALLGRPSDTPVPETELPRVLERVALTREQGEATFTSDALDASGTPWTTGTGPAGLPAVDELQRMALEHNPDLRSRELRIMADERTRSFAALGKRPDVNVSAGYSFRRDLGDFFSFMVSAPIPIFAGRKQDQAVIEADAAVDERRSALQSATDELHQRIASTAAELRRAQEQLLLLREGILPQARAVLTSATASYRVGNVDFLTLLDAQVSVFRHELDYDRLLTDFATQLAALERAVGTEVLP